MIRILHIIDERFDWTTRIILEQLLSGLDVSTYQQEVAAVTPDGKAPAFSPQTVFLGTKSGAKIQVGHGLIKLALKNEYTIVHDWGNVLSETCGIPGILQRRKWGTSSLVIEQSYLESLDRALIRDRLGFTPDHIVVSTPCPVTEDGGHFAAFWSTAIRSFLDTSITVLLPGETPETRRLIQGASKIKLPHIATSPDLNEYRYEELLVASDVLLFVPEKNNADSSCIPWAQAAGIPVIATSVESAQQWITDGETGILMEPGEPKRLATRLASAMGKRKQLAEIAASAKQYICNSQHCGSIAEDFADRYQRLLNDA